MITAEAVLAILLKLEPHAVHRPTFEATAAAIADASNASPLFSGEHGAEKTANVLAATADFESGLIPNAEGDCILKGKLVASKAGVCPTGATPHSFCALQVNESNFKTLGITREEVQTDINVCVRSGLRLMHTSFQVCRARPLEERLAHYAGGRDGCPTNEDATKKSRHRMMRALWLFKQLSPP